MSITLNRCPKCGAFQYSDNIVKAHNPDTTDMNMQATLRCNKCNHEWEGFVTSPHHKQGREQGWYI